MRTNNTTLNHIGQEHYDKRWNYKGFPGGIEIYETVNTGGVTLYRVSVR